MNDQAFAAVNAILTGTAIMTKPALRGPQIEILKTLNRAKNYINRRQISERSGVDEASLCEYVGSSKDSVRLANDRKHFTSLISLGMVEQKTFNVDGVIEVAYKITTTGKEAIA